MIRASESYLPWKCEFVSQSAWDRKKFRHPQRSYAMNGGNLWKLFVTWAGRLFAKNKEMRRRKKAENIFEHWNFRFALTMKLLLSFWMLNPFSAVLRLASKFISRATLSTRKPLSCYYFSSIFSIPFFNPSIIFHLNFHANKRIHFNDYIYWNRNSASKLFAAAASPHSNKVIYLKMPVVCARYAKCGTFGFLNVYYWIFCSPFSNHFSPWHSHDKGSKHKNFKHEIKKSS